jgi:hypothetical protein
MLACSVVVAVVVVLLEAACPNPQVTIRTGTRVSRRIFFMESS